MCKPSLEPMKTSPIPEYTSRAIECPFRVRLATNISAQFSVRIEPLKLFPIHMPFKSVLRLPFMRDDNEGRNRDRCPYLVGSPNEQSHQTSLLTTFTIVQRVVSFVYSTSNHGHLLQSEQCCSPDHWCWGIRYVWGSKRFPCVL